MVKNGWFYESYRHSLAARGIRTAFASVPWDSPMRLKPYRFPSVEQRRADISRLREASRRAKVFDPMLAIPDEPLQYTGPPEFTNRGPFRKLSPEQMRMVEGAYASDPSLWQGSRAPVLSPEQMERLNEIIAAGTMPGAVEISGRELPGFMPGVAVEPMFGIGAPSRRAEIAKMTGDLSGLNQQEIEYVLDIGLYADKRVPGYSGQRLSYLPPELYNKEMEFARKEEAILSAHATGQIGALTKDNLLKQVADDRRAMIRENYGNILDYTNKVMEERRRQYITETRGPPVSRQSSGFFSLDVVDPFTGRVKSYSYTPGSLRERETKGEDDYEPTMDDFDYVPTRREKSIETMIENKQKDWKMFIDDLRKTDPDLPMAQNINQVVDWLSSKRGIDPDAIRESLLPLVSKYRFRRSRKQPDEPFTRVAPSSVEIPLTVQERIKEALSGGTYFNTEEEARMFTAGRQGYELKKELTDDGDVVYSVSKPLQDFGGPSPEGPLVMPSLRQVGPMRSKYKEKLIRQERGLE